MSRLMRRLSRTLGWDRNPLRRRVDRVEVAIFAALFVILPVVAPVVSTLAGRAVVADAGTWQHAQQSWRQVSAVIEHRSAIPAGKLDGMFLCPEALARWTAPDGRSRTGWVETAPGARAGGRVRVWVDKSGAVTGPPVGTALVNELRILAEVAAPVVLALVLYTAGRAARFVLDRRRLAGWEKAWQAVGPQWSRRC
jgi:hypothetical protein